jgi:hypothetical protein
LAVSAIATAAGRLEPDDAVWQRPPGFPHGDREFQATRFPLAELVTESR